MSTGPLDNRPAERGIGSGIGNNPCLHPHQTAFGVTGGCKFNLHRMPFGVDPHTFLARQSQLDRLASLVGEQCGMMLH